MQHSNIYWAFTGVCAVLVALVYARRRETQLRESEKAKGLYARGLEAEEKDCCALHDEVTNLEQQLQAQQETTTRL